MQKCKNSKWTRWKLVRHVTIIRFQRVFIILPRNKNFSLRARAGREIKVVSVWLENKENRKRLSYHVRGCEKIKPRPWFKKHALKIYRWVGWSPEVSRADPLIDLAELLMQIHTVDTNRLSNRQFSRTICLIITSLNPIVKLTKWRVSKWEASRYQAS